MIQFIQAHPGINMELTNISLPRDLQLGYARYGVRKEDVDLNSAISRALMEMRADGTTLKFLTQVGLPARNIFNFPIPSK